jgi:hypothetical protein
MTHATPLLRGSATVTLRRSLPVDVIVALVFLVLFGFVLNSFQYRDMLAESDIYRVLVGMLDGANSGSGIASKLHYDNTFGFGYLGAFYAFASPATLRDPDRLTGLINDVGFWSMMAGLVFFWCAVSVAHGARAGTVALIVFALAPTVAELGTSGHPVIPMFALLCAAATLLFLPVTGWHAVVAAIAGGVLLLAGLMTRGDVFLAFPWLVLTRIDTRSLRGFIVSGLVRSIAPVAAVIVYCVLQHLIVPHQVGPVLNEFFGRWVRISFIAGNVLFIPLGFGIATTAVAAVAALWLTVRARPGDDGRGQNGMAQFLGPAALTLVPLGFFVANQGPTRHFMMTYAGLSILLAVWLTATLAMRRVVALGVVVLLTGASQVLAEAVRLPVLAANDARSPFRPVWTGYLTATHAPLGFFWKRHDSLAHRRALWQAEGDKLTTPCQSHTVVLTGETAQLFSRLYAGGTPVEAQQAGADDIFGRVGAARAITMFALQEVTIWPKDPVATVVADPAYKDYKLYQDPYTLSVYDRTPIPPNRQAKFGCSAPSE